VESDVLAAATTIRLMFRERKEHQTMAMENAEWLCT
jgi:hypothetical protein